MKMQLFFSKSRAILLMVVIFSLLFSTTYLTFAHPHTVDMVDPSVFVEGTTIGTIDISGLTFYEAHDLLYDKLDQWSKTGSITIRHNDAEVILLGSDPSFVFDAGQDVEKAWEQKTSVPLTININETVLKNHLVESFSAEIAEQIDMLALSEQIQSSVALLSVENKMINVMGNNDAEKIEDQPLVKLSNGAVANGVISYGKNADVTTLLQSLDGIEFEKDVVFSLLQFIEENDIEVTNEALSVVATGIYEAIAQTNFVVFERHTGRRLPSYSKLGLEAKVVAGQADLKFHHSNPNPYTLKISNPNNQIIFSIFGDEFEETYSLKFVNKKEYEPRTIVQYSADKSGARSGAMGYSVDVYRVVENSNEVIEQLISRDFYAPLHRVVIN